MHWFWRSLAAVVVACLYGGLAVTVFESPHEFMANFVVDSLGGTWPSGPSWRMGVAVAVGWFLPVVVLAMFVFGVMARCFGPKELRDRETRCRRCGYILRGIPEPRCSECGERI